MISQNERSDGPTPHPCGAFLPHADFERDEVRKHLSKILDSPAFHNCKRYAAVLKYIVDQTLDGFGEQLKERTIGIDVFQRVPDYDTATDHAVRSAVAEVRKRLGQYYQQDASSPLRIDVLPGSYMPQFRWIEETSAPPSRSPVSNSEEPAPPPKPTQRKWARSWLRPKWLALGCLILFASCVVYMAAGRDDDPRATFWKPVLSSRAPVLLCMGNLAGARESTATNRSSNSTLTLGDFHSLDTETVNVYDAITAARLAGMIEASDKSLRIVSQSDATFTDLQNGPTILVGLMNNSWTGRLLPNLRFTLEQTTPTKVTVRDRKNPSNQEWSIDYATPYLEVNRDYALVLRMVDPKTEQPVIVVAGITVFGTFAAGEFLTSKNEMKKLAAIAPPGWEKKNMEMVLSTDVIRGRSGPAQVVAAQFW